ncbi:hypothetical protein NP493_1595g00037 [Ridgeia piscesae]|uniref:UNC93-like protein n=1 Tax=Ridgeia piscesae TaxID=27915 RepID=A0AAD9JZT1_RIDPI|nr:hypothetical protein NP493_1595g00037 [Ridgeia piscesae]
MSLSPWDLSGNIRFDFPSNRPRRASYLFATQLARRRNESYKNATQKPETSGEDASTDFIEGVVRTKRKDSYKAATRHQHEQHELADVDVLAASSSATSGSAAATNHVPVPTIVEVSAAGDSRILRQLSQSTLIDEVTPSNDVTPVKGYPNATNGHTQAAGSAAAAAAPVRTGAETPDYSDEEARRSSWTYRRNLFVLTAGFILVFSAFRSIQNVQSSLNTRHRLGVVTMGVVHLSMFATCLFAPVLINKFTSKWTIVLGLLFYLFWVAANFYPHFYTLLPTSVGVGFGQSLAWGAQVTYMQKLATGHARATRELTQYEMYKFNGVFLACFQTSHVWGNLVSSLMLAGMPRSGVGAGEYCGVYDQCLDDANPLYDNLPTKNGTAGR